AGDLPYTVTDATHKVTYDPDLNYNNTSLTPDTFQFVVNDGGFDSTPGTVSITVNPVNDPPVLAAIGDKNVDEQTLLSFSASATDADLPANTLSYSLANGTGTCTGGTTTKPTGASIDGSSGAFSWTPTEAQGPGKYCFKVVVTDNGTPALSDSREITVTVAEVNVAPVLAAITDKNVDDRPLLSFSLSPYTTLFRSNTLSYSLANGTGTCVGGTTTKPSGASIDSSSGAFSWTPTEEQGAGKYCFKVVVTDNGTPALSDSREITVTVAEVNVAPVLAAITDKNVDDRPLLSFSLSPYTTLFRSNTLSYSLANGTGTCVGGTTTKPSGASIDSSS